MVSFGMGSSAFTAIRMPGMSDTRERVALAIWNARERTFPLKTKRAWDEIDAATGAKELVFQQADAALSACG